MNFLFFMLVASAGFAAVPNDPLFSYDPARRLPYADASGVYFRDEYQWPHQNIAANTRCWLFNGTLMAEYDEPVGTSSIEALAGWDVATDARRCRVAVLDVGVDATHPDLSNNVTRVILTTASHVPSNHGTAVASVLAAEGNNGIGMAGICWRADVVAIEYDYRPPTLIAGLDAAIAAGCRIICVAWGSELNDASVLAAFLRVRDAGLLVVCSTLNDPSDMDAHAPDYPSSWGLENVVTVTSSTRDGQIYSWAARGSNSVHLAAPGRLIPVCVPGGNYRYWSGTSYAAPLVAGAAALYWSQHPEVAATQVKRALLATVTKSPAFNATISGGMLNLGALLQSPKPPTVRTTNITKL